MNPLGGDTALFADYLEALDEVVADPEIRAALDEFGLSPNTLRMNMVVHARRVLESAPGEFAVYTDARARMAEAREARLSLSPDVDRLLLLVGTPAALGGALLAAAGAAAGSLWRWAQPLLWAGITVLVVVGLLLAVRWLLGTGAGLNFAARRLAPAFLPALDDARGRLIAAVAAGELMAQARTFINRARQDRFGHSCSVQNIAGLSETYDGTYQVPTRTAAELDALITRLDGASIGIAGPRGSGKSTLIRQYCGEEGPGPDDLRCMVAAPVDYDARDFVLHLFATFCRGVIGRAKARRAEALSLNAVAGLLGVLNIARRTRRNLRRVRARRRDNPQLAATARRLLDRVRYLQTHTSGWSGTVQLPGGAGGQFSRGHSREEQPLSYPEIVSEFRSFARDVAAGPHESGDRVFIGVDELDKIGGPEQAETFLNEIKGVFGIPHVYFIVSVSDDALTAFERRGLPLRDAFDSSFDEIITVGPLGYPESRRLLYRRVIGLTEPYVALCHCLAGGLARDLIRAARQVIRAGESLTGDGDPSPVRQMPDLGAVCSAVIRDELRRKARAVAQVVSNTAPGQGRDLQHALAEIGPHLGPGTPAIKVVDLVGQAVPGEPDAVSGLRLDFAAYAYYCATLQEAFTESLDAARMIEATTASGEPGTFDALAAARHAFALDTHLAWRITTQFRQAWSLSTRDPASDDGGG